MRLFFFFALLSTTFVSLAQSKKNSKSNAEKKQPPIVYHEDVKIDTLPKYEMSPETTELKSTGADGFYISPSPEFPDIDTTLPSEDDFTNDIRKLLALVKAEETDVKMGELSLAQSIGSDTSKLMKAFYNQFTYELREGRARRWLRNLYIKAYRNSFTHEDVKSLIQFYQTALGKNILKKMPGLLQQVMMESQNIGRYLGGKLMMEVMEQQKQR